MSPLAIALVLSSTFLHAGWNLLARRRGSEGAFFGRMLLVGNLLGLAPAVISEALNQSLSAAAWGYVAGSGLCAGLYYASLARAYRHGDFTTVYPVARALPVLIVGLLDPLFGRTVAPAGWLGMALVVAGCLLTPLTSLRDIAPRRYFNRASLWMLLTAFGTVGYTLLDKAASETLHGPASALRYGYFFFLFSWAAFVPLQRVIPDAAPLNPVPWRLALLGAFCNFGAYALVLWAYQLSANASYVLAFRQLSIVIGVVAASVFFREPGRTIRLAGSLVLTAGLLLLALAG